MQNRILGEPYLTGAARGGTTDASSRLYIADQTSLELAVVSLITGKSLFRDRIPFNMSPQDVALAPDGTVYVVAINPWTAGEAVFTYTVTSR